MGSPISTAVSWAFNAGIISGTGTGAFSPEGDITREQIATMIYRYKQFKKEDVSKTADLSVFADFGDISGYAKDALMFAHAEKIINGMGDGRIEPKGGVSRGQVAQILFNLKD
jgi:hypothetical protein